MAMNQTPNLPEDEPGTPDHNRGNTHGAETGSGTEPPKRSGALLWLLLLVALLLLGWWWFAQRDITAPTPEPAAGVTSGEPAATTAATEAEKAAAQARKKVPTAPEPRKPRKPVTPRLTEARAIAGRNPQPEYPREAQRRGLSGRVLLRVDVAADGSVADVDFAQRSGTPELDRAAMRAVRKWRFVPARRDGKPVASRVNVPIDFVLPDDPQRK
jgi:protein TonB